MLKISIDKQCLQVLNDDSLQDEFLVSTAQNGVGEEMNSGKTPRGWHQVRAKIGDQCPVNTVFKARRPTGEIYSEALAQTFPDRDWILTRILWLSGLEPGKNRHGSLDTMRRFIYIHGTPDSVLLGKPGSHGCIRMNNHDLIRLFDGVAVGTKLLIE